MKKSGKFWEILCYAVGLAGFIVASIVQIYLQQVSAWVTVMTVAELLFMAILCAGLVLGIVRNRKFNVNILLRIAVLIVVGTDIVLTAWKAFF